MNAQRATDADVIAAAKLIYADDLSERFGTNAPEIFTECERIARVVLNSRPGVEADWEYGIVHYRMPGMHREGLTRQDAREWIAGWEEDGGKPGVFSILRRQRGPWEELIP